MLPGGSVSAEVVMQLIAVPHLLFATALPRQHRVDDQG